MFAAARPHTAHLGRGARAGDRPRADRRGAGAGGRHRQASPLAYPTGPERRERAQRRHLRPAALHRASHRRGGGERHRRRSRGSHRRARRSATASSAASPPEPSRLSSCASSSRGALSPTDWLQVIPLAAAGAGVRHRRSARRQRLHRRLRRWACLRRPSPCDDSEVTYLTDATGPGAGRCDVCRLRRRRAWPRNFTSSTGRSCSTPCSSLTIIRMGPVWLALRGSGARPPTVAYTGWFGPSRPGLDRLRGAGPRGLRARAHRDDDRYGGDHGRAVRLRPRCHRRPADDGICALVRRPTRSLRPWRAFRPPNSPGAGDSARQASTKRQ